MSSQTPSLATHRLPRFTMMSQYRDRLSPAVHPPYGIASSTATTKGLFPQLSQVMSTVKQESHMVLSAFVNTDALDPLRLSQAAWVNDSVMMKESMEFSKSMYRFENFCDYDQAELVEPMMINDKDPMMLDWDNTGDLDLSAFTQNARGT